MSADFFHHLGGFFTRDLQLVLLDLADISLVAFGLYYVLLLLRGTRAMQMGVGLGLIFVVYQVAKRLGLVTLYAMLDTLLTSFVLIVVVIFQHDIRRALMRFGQRPFFRSVHSALEGRVIDETVKAAYALAQKRIGALIVFEREASLDEFIESGTVLSADLSQQLLYSIFIPSFENPMHDGAVIIRDGRIWQAGTFLPLTASPKVDRALGTRHRAAIGLSEETDAVVLVVSEERGAVSVCFNGNIVRNLDSASLRKVLLSLFAPTPRRRGSKAGDDTGRASTTGRKSAGSEPREPGPERPGGGEEA